MKTYGYLPIVKRKDLPELTPYPERHLKREIDCLTEMIAALALISNDDIRSVLAKYKAKLVESEDGSRVIGVEFPEKRFY